MFGENPNEAIEEVVEVIAGLNEEQTKEYIENADATGTPVPDDRKSFSYNPLAAKGKVIDISTCICGGGKTEDMIARLTKEYSSGERNGVTIIGTITNNLGEQTWEKLYNNFAGEGVLLDERKGFKDGFVQCELVNSSDLSPHKGAVLATLVGVLDEEPNPEDEDFVEGDYEYNGIMVTSHKSLLDIPPKFLKRADIIIDEIPTQFLEWVKIEANANMLHGMLEKWCEYTPYSESQKVDLDDEPVTETETNNTSGKDTKKYQLVKLKDKHRMDALDFVIGSRKLEDGYEDTNVETTNLVECLLYGFDPITMHVKGDPLAKFASVRYVYEGMSSWKTYKMARYSRHLTILAASINDSVAGMLLQDRFGVKFNSISDHLQQKHKVPATVIPFLKEGQFSASLKKNDADTALEGEQGGGDVMKKFFEFTHDVFGDEYLMFLNQKNSWVQGGKETKHHIGVRAQKQLKIQEHSTSVHGMNNMTEFVNASFMASLRPKGDEEQAIFRFAEGCGLPKRKFLNHVVKERMYEAGYQCLLRTAARAPFSYETGEINELAEKCTFIVPDMDFVKYLSERFEPGMLTVKTDKSKVRVHKSQIVADEDERWARLVRYHEIKRDNANRPAGVPNKSAKEMLAEAGYFNAKGVVDRQLKSRDLKHDFGRFRKALEEIGLIKRHGNYQGSRKGVE